jgi:hypothetical protein
LNGWFTGFDIHPNQEATMPKAKTHFEQIPLEEVKKLVQKNEPEVKRPNPGEVDVESPETKTEPYSVRASSD